MIAKVNRNILIGFLILFFMAWNGIDSVVATTRTNIVDEMLNGHILKMQKIEKGEKVFMQLLEERKDQIPVIGTPDYVKLLFYYADPSGSLRRSNPQKWELVDAYAYDFYEKHMLPRVSPEDAGKQYYEPLAYVSGTRDALQQEAVYSIQNLYNRQGAVNYAVKHAGHPTDQPLNKHYNPNYYFTTADCTNFVSQVLHEGGGVPKVDAWWRPWWDKDDWYYHRTGTDPFDANNDDSWSWSWVKAGTLYWHIQARLGTLVNSPSQLRLGDVIQIDFTSDGTIDHTMVVTMIDSSGNIRVSQHTTNRTNEPLINYFSPGRAFYYLNITY